VTDIYIASQNGIFHPGPTFSISGRVVAYGGAPLGGVIVAAGSAASVLSNANGNYTITGLITGTYTLTAAKSGYRFSGLSPVAVPPTRTGQNFMGTLLSNVAYLPLVRR
jgi:carboxypeptidase family protein